jgi:hypothetical protein
MPGLPEMPELPDMPELPEMPDLPEALSDPPAPGVPPVVPDPLHADDAKAPKMAAQSAARRSFPTLT